MTPSEAAAATLADALQGREPIGAQPDVVVISPSRAYPWYGTRAPGARFTGPQVYAVRHLGDAPEAVRALTCYREATDREMWWPLNSLPPVFSFDCPIKFYQRRAAGGRVGVIACDGALQLVARSGWIGRVTRPAW